jgi:hypothetical protein
MIASSSSDWVTLRQSLPGADLNWRVVNVAAASKKIRLACLMAFPKQLMM